MISIPFVGIGGLEPGDACDGGSVGSLLRGEAEDKVTAAIMTYQHGNNTVRTTPCALHRYVDDIRNSMIRRPIRWGVEQCGFENRVC